MEYDAHHTILASLSAQKYVSICAHGTVHLTWGMTTLRFRPQDFEYLGRVLHHKTSCPDQALCNDPVCLFTIQESGFTLRILDFSLHLAPVDFLMLVDMVVTALQQMNTLPFETAQPAPITLPRQTECRMTFSHN